MPDSEFNAISRLTAKKIPQPRNTSLVQMAVQAAPPEETKSVPLQESVVDIIPSMPAPIEIAAGMLRIEVPINAEIQTLCIQEKISRDTLVEAAWLFIKANPEVKSQVVAEAKKRYDKRKAVGNAKRAQSMEKYKILE